jgi:RNA polymerase sigma-70 factor (ECF subfamily)
MTGRDDEAGTALEAISYLYDRYGARLYGYALALLSDVSDAEDVVQDVFAKVYVQLKKGHRPDDAMKYLFRSARNEAYSKLRRRWLFARTVRRGIDVSMLSAPDDSPAGERESLTVALQRLPVKQREVVVLKIYESMTFEEIGAMLRISTSTAASRYRYGIERLRMTLKREDF